jgi:hypothetical protein
MKTFIPVINKYMKTKTADNFFDSIDFVSIKDTVKGIYTSDGTMSTILDFERVLDDADLYAFKNWIKGELVQGPDVGRYTTSCTFMWPYKMMPDPRGVTRLLKIGCRVEFAKSKIKVPVKVTNYDDLVPGGNYPRMQEKPVWFVKIEIPLELMDSIKEGSIELADRTIDLADIDEAYDDDLDQDAKQQDQEELQGDMGMGPGMEPQAQPGQF